MFATALYSFAVWLFVTAGRGTPLPFSPPQLFVARGPYRYTRNPMALSVVVGAMGASSLFGSALGSLATILVALVLHAYITRREEPALVQRFGESYVAYCEDVPRWAFGRSSPS